MHIASRRFFQKCLQRPWDGASGEKGNCRRMTGGRQEAVTEARFCAMLGRSVTKWGGSGNGTLREWTHLWRVGLPTLDCAAVAKPAISVYLMYRVRRL